MNKGERTCLTFYLLHFPTRSCIYSENIKLDWGCNLLRCELILKGLLDFFFSSVTSNSVNS